MSSSLELLDRQYERLQAAEGPAFLRELKRYRDLLREQEDAARLVDALTADTEAVQRAFIEHDDALVQDLVELRRELVERAPDLDDSAMQRPEDFRAQRIDWQYSLANFDQVAERGPDALYQRQGLDDSRSGLLLRILEAKLQAAQWRIGEPPAMRIADENQRPELDDLALRLGNLADTHRHARATYEQAIAEGGVALAHIDLVLAEANPPPRQIEGEEDRNKWINEEFKRILAGLHVVGPALRPPGHENLDRRDLDVVTALVERLRPSAERLHEDVRLRLVRAPQPEPSYGQRIAQWVRSATGQMFVLPLVGQAVVRLAEGETKDLLPLLPLAAAAVLLPPAASGSVFPRIGLTWFTAGFILVATVLMVIATSVWGLGAGVLTFATAVTAFLFGVRAERARAGQ